MSNRITRRSGPTLRRGWRQVIAFMTAACFMLGAMSLPVAAGTAPTQVTEVEVKAGPEISLNEAVTMSLVYSDRVKKATREIDRTEKLREQAAEDLDFIPIFPSGNAYLEMGWTNILTKDLQWRMSKKSLTAEEDAVVLDTCKKYWDVLVAQEKVETAQVAADSALKLLQNARAGYQVGTATQAVRIGAEAQYRGAQAALEAAQNELETAYIALNRLIGKQPETKPILTDTVEFDPIVVYSLESEISRVLIECPQVWLTEQKVTLQEYLKDVMVYAGGEYRPYDARRIEIEQAEYDAADTKKAFKQITRSLYYGVMSLEEGYAGALEGVRAAEENLRVVKARYEVGMATRSEISAAEQTLSDAQARAFDLSCQHAYMKLAFKKPWAYLSGMSAGGA
jgi:outer membrane protein